MKKTWIALIAILVVAVATLAVSGAEEEKYEAGLASAISTNHPDERELSAKCEKAIKAAGIDIVEDSLYIDYANEGRVYFLTPNGVEWTELEREPNSDDTKIIFHAGNAWLLSSYAQ